MLNSKNNTENIELKNYYNCDKTLGPLYIFYNL